MDFRFGTRWVVIGLVSNRQTEIIDSMWNVASFESYEVAEAYKDGISQAWEIFVEKFKNRERFLCGYLVGENPFDLEQQMIVDPNDSFVIFHVDEIKHLAF